MGFKFIKTADLENPHDKADITVSIEDNDVTMTTLFEVFNTFCLAVGYSEETVRNAIKEFE